MDDGVEEPAISPAGGEVITAQALVTFHHALRPQQQLLLGSHIVWLTADLDVRDLEESRKTANWRAKHDKNVLYTEQ